MITDDYALATTPQAIVLSIITPANVDLSNAGQISFGARPILGDRVAGAGTLDYDAAIFSVHTETIPITDERLGGTWGEMLTRVVLKATQPAAHGVWRFRFVPAT